MNARVSRRWQRRISILAVLLGLSVYVYKAERTLSQFLVVRGCA